MKITDLTFIDLKMMFTMFRNDGIMDMINFENKLGSHPYLEGKHKIIKDLVAKYDTKDDAQFEELMNVIAKAISEVNIHDYQLNNCSKDFMNQMVKAIRATMENTGVVLHSKKAMLQSVKDLEDLSPKSFEDTFVHTVVRSMILECQDDFDLLDHYHILRLIGEQL